MCRATGGLQAQIYLKSLPSDPGV